MKPHSPAGPNPIARSLSLTLLLLSALFLGETRALAQDLWQLAQNTASIHRFSTLFTAHDVKNHLSTEQGRSDAKSWCRQTAVTKVYIESFRDGYQAEREALVRARQDFEAAGFLVSGCVTTTQVGKKSGGWNLISCYTDLPTQERIKQIFESTAGLFDEIMIDDFWFTDCACPECDAARLAQKVTIGSKTFPTPGPTWQDYRCELMVRLSQENVLRAARQINPRVKIIIKYPQWYDRFHERGYEVLRETRDFDRIWVGTETRDYQDSRWGGTVQYEGYFIMRWLGGIGESKCGGGWYDWLGTTEQTYVEQARQTILAGAEESLLFCYGGLQGSTGPANIAALRQNIPELQQVARECQKRRPVGIAAYKPANSHPEKEARVFDFVGMLGLPLNPTHQFPTNAPAAFFSIHAASDPGFSTNLLAYIHSGKPVLITDGLAARLPASIDLNSPNVQILTVRGDPKTLLNLPSAELEQIREPLLSALHLQFTAPVGVALYPFDDGSWVIENFNDRPLEARLNQEQIPIPARGWTRHWK